MGKLNNLAIIVLCGGASRRMGYPKALLPVGSELMVERVCRLAGEISNEIILVTSPQQNLPELSSNIQIIEDREPFQGPLPAMFKGLQSINTDIEFAFVTAVDTPRLNPEIIQFLYSKIANSDFELIMPYDDSYFYPLTAIYRVKPTLNEIQNLLIQKKFRPVFLMDNLKSLKLNVDELRMIDADLNSFQNLNTRSEYRKSMNKLNLEIPASFKLKTVTLEFYGTCRLITGTPSCKLECDFYHDLVRNLEMKYPSLTNRVVFDGCLHRAFRLIRNNSEFIDNFNDAPDDGDTIMLINADAGG